MSETLPKTNTFHISFKVKGEYLQAVKVTIEDDVIDAADRVRIDLADHPLYLQLQGYVLANPRP